MNNHGYGRSLQGEERRANNFEKRLKKWINNVNKMAELQKERQHENLKDKKE